MVTLSRIVTKTGDQGETSLGDGSRVRKYHPRVVAYGTVDELNAYIGMLVSIEPAAPEQDLLRTVQNDLFDLGADLCTPTTVPEVAGKHLRVQSSQISQLETAIERLNAKLPPLQSFVLPGGTLAASWAHLARTVCRRAEREVVRLSTDVSINPLVLIYLNRLSDLLFVLARVANQRENREILWTPGGKRDTPSAT